MMSRWYMKLFLCMAVTFGLLASVAGKLGADHRDKPERKNMRLVGHNDLQARSAYQPLPHFQNGRWIAYVGHHGGTAVNRLNGQPEVNGVSIVDVTNPRHPVYLAHIPGDAGAGGTQAQMVRACNGSDLPAGDPSKVYLLRATNRAHEIWDVSTPETPSFVTAVVANLANTHKNWWECETGIAYLVSAVPDWRVSRVTQVFDLSDPTNPKHIRDFGLVGQQPGAEGPFDPQGPHGCISVPERNRVYCGHGTSSNGILVILDRQKLLDGDPSDPYDPTNPTPAQLNAPLVSRLNTSNYMGAHTTFPVFDLFVPELAKDADLQTRNFVLLVNEAGGNECTGALRQMVFLVDITDETNPWPIANFNVAEARGDFCDRGGRFGAHASNESFTSVFYRKLVFVSWFNAGVRAIDIREPFSPKEAGFFIPATTANTDERCITVDGKERCKIAIQTNNVEVDDRGLIYTADRANTGLHILKLTGKAAKIAGLDRDRDDDDDDDDD